MEILALSNKAEKIKPVLQNVRQELQEFFGHKCILLYGTRNDVVYWIDIYDDEIRVNRKPATDNDITIHYTVEEVLKYITDGV